MANKTFETSNSNRHFDLLLSVFIRPFALLLFEEAEGWQRAKMSLEEPKQKKMKLKQEEEEERERHHDGGDDGDEEYELGAEEADKKDQSTLLMRNDAGEAYCELSNKRRLTVRKYKGTVFVDLREVCCTTFCVGKFLVALL